MRKSIIVFLCVTVAVVAAFANGNAEKLTSLEGTVVLVPSEGAQVQLMLRTAEGDVIVEMPVQEVLRLELREQERIRVDGVLVGAPSGEQVRARILARVVDADGQEYTVEKPLRLTAQDRTQIRAYEAEQAQLRTQTRDQTQTQTQTQLREGEGTGSGSGGSGGTGNK